MRLPAAIAATGALAGCALAGLAIGPVHIAPLAIAQSAVAKLPLVHTNSPLAPAQDAIVWQLRAPRVALAVLVGGMLAVAGASYQGVFRNPLADPYLLGVAGGAGLGATLVIAYGGGGASALLPPAAFAGALLAVAAAYLLARSASMSGGASPALVLAGVTVAAFFTAVQTFVQQQHSDTLQTVYSWILGRLDTAGWSDVLLVLPYILVAAIGLLLHRRMLDVMALGDEEAAALGLNVARVRGAIIAAATLGTAAAVAASGLIGFVGIIVPHAIRLTAGGRYRALLPLSVALGGGFLVLADIAARTLLAPAEIPVGVITAVVGAPFFAIVLRTARVVG